jgi:hypothetical protein
MNIAIRRKGIRLASDLQAALCQRLENALSHVQPRVQRIQVFFADANGRKGGIDKMCRVVAHVRRQPALVVEDRDSDLRTLIGRICERVGQVAERRLDRSRNRGSRCSMAGAN